MTYNIVATGSRGNAVVINERILIDCGVPYYKLEPHADKIKLEEMQAAGWKVVDNGVIYDADGQEPPRAFYLLGFNAQSET